MTAVDEPLQRSVEWRLRLLTRAVDLLPDGMALVDNDGWYRLVNPAFAALHGCGDADSLLGSHFTVFYSPPDQRGPVDDLIAAARRDGTAQGELVRRRRDGSRFPAHVTLSLLHDDGGEPVGQVMTVRDLSGGPAERGQ